MNREEIEQRLVELDQERAKAFAHINAIDGAKMELRYWLEKLEQEKNDEG